MHDAIHPQVRALLEAMAAGPDGDPPPDLAAERAAYVETSVRLGGAPEPVAAVEDVLVQCDDARVVGALYRPLHAPDADGAIVWLHGGGWCLGDIPSFDRVFRALANATGENVLAVDYRLAPEHPWPAQVQDAGAALRWARSAAGAQRLAIDPTRVIVGGDSAGGQLAAVAARHARGDGLPAPAAQLLVYPALDPTLSGPAFEEFADGPMLTRDDMERCWGVYLDGRDATHPDIDVLRAGDAAGLPPAWIAVAGLDPLRDDGLRYAAALRAGGVAVEDRVFDDMVHGFLRWGGVVDRTGELIAWLGDAARAVLRT